MHQPSPQDPGQYIAKLASQKNRVNLLRRANLTYEVFSAEQLDHGLRDLVALAKHDDFALKVILKIMSGINVQFNGEAILDILDALYYRQQFIADLFRNLRMSNSARSIDDLMIRGISTRRKNLLLVYLTNQTSVQPGLFDKLLEKQYNGSVGAFLQAITQAFWRAESLNALGSDALTHIYQQYIQPQVLNSTRPGSNTYKWCIRFLPLLLARSTFQLGPPDRLFFQRLLGAASVDPWIRLQVQVALCWSYCKECSAELESAEPVCRGLAYVLGLLAYDPNFRISPAEAIEFIQANTRLLERLLTGDQPRELLEECRVGELLVQSAPRLHPGQIHQIQRIEMLLKLIDQVSRVRVDIDGILRGQDVYQTYFAVYLLSKLHGDITCELSAVRFIQQNEVEDKMAIRLIGVTNTGPHVQQYLRQLHSRNAVLFYQMLQVVNQDGLEAFRDLVWQDLHNYLGDIQLTASHCELFKLLGNGRWVPSGEDAALAMQLAQQFIVQVVRVYNVRVASMKQQDVLLQFLRFLAQLARQADAPGHGTLFVNLTDLDMLHFRETRYLMGDILSGMLSRGASAQTVQRIAHHQLQMAQSGIPQIKQIAAFNLGTLLRCRFTEAIIPTLYYFKFVNSKQVKLAVLKAFASARVGPPLAIRLINFAVQQNDVNFREHGLRYMISLCLDQMELKVYIHFLNLVQFNMLDEQLVGLCEEYIGLAACEAVHGHMVRYLVRYVQVGLFAAKRRVREIYHAYLERIRRQCDYVLCRDCAGYTRVHRARQACDRFRRPSSLAENCLFTSELEVCTAHAACR